MTARSDTLDMPVDSTTYDCSGSSRTLTLMPHSILSLACIAMVPKVGGTAPWGAVGLTRWALIGTRGGRERCYYHRRELVDK
jgi:hypothetical protein